MYSFPNLGAVHCSMAGSNCCFLTCMQIAQAAGKAVWYFHLMKNSPFLVIHTDNGFESKVKVKVSQSCPTLQPHTVCGILQGRTLEWVAFPFSRGSSHPRIKPRSPTLQVDSLLAKPKGKPKNTGVGSLSVIQQIFLTQESNQGLLQYWRVL